MGNPDLAGFTADFGRFYWKIYRRCVSIHPILTSLLHCSLAEIIPDPNPLTIPPFIAMFAAIACAPIVLGRHWERHYHKVCIAPWPAHLESGKSRLFLSNPKADRRTES